VEAWVEPDNTRSTAVLTRCGFEFEGRLAFVPDGLTPATALARLRELSVEECQLVVCHGDYTPPNVLLDAGGSRATSISVR
jgi:hypothetical protein